MRSRTIKALLSLSAVAALAVPGVAQARHGADDPAGHVRHASHARHHAKHHVKKHHASKAHHVRHGHGADDGPNHR
jgi:nicotinamide mononucleotide (NMN) deamidase PncC